MRLSIAAAAACLLIVGVAAADQAAAAIKRFTNIPAQELGSALQTLAQERDLQVVYLSDTVDNLRTSGAIGDFTADEALQKLLSGTGLSYRYLDEKTITVLPARGGPATSPKGNSGVRSKAAGDGAFAVYASGESDASGRGEGAQPADEGSKIEEIIVTAQKRSERLQDVPVPVTAISAADLVERNLVTLQDYYSKFPSLNVTPTTASQTFVTIRGITTGSGNPTVGVLIDDVPFGATTLVGGGAIFPDLDPGDLQGIEVLRGPQGTLYGANSMGGLIKFVTPTPSTDSFSGKLQGGIVNVYGGSGVGYDGRGEVNVPLTDTLAVSGSVYHRVDPGYIDNIRTGQSDINQVDTTGGRLSALWHLPASFTLKLNAIVRDSHADGNSESDFGLADLQQSRIPGTGTYQRKNQLYSAVLTGDVGGIGVTSVTGYGLNRAYNTYDGKAAPQIQTNDFRTDRFTEEVRLTATVFERVDLLLGGFFSNEHNRSTILILPANVNTGVTNGISLDLQTFAPFREHAVFGDATFRFSERFDVQLGGRESFIDQSQYSLGQTPVAQSSNTFTYLVTPRYRLSDNFMLYARGASGYRAGGGSSNPGPTDLCVLNNFPCSYASDKTENYEIGAKGLFLDGKLSVDASLYRIDWQNMQLTLARLITIPVTAAASYTTNGGTATSQGVEISVQTTPFAGTTLGGWFAWSDPKLTEDFPAGSTATGHDGDRLPYSSRISFDLSLNQSFRLSARTTAFVGGDVNYIGEREGRFIAGIAPRAQFPAYTTLGLRAGLQYGSWTGRLYGNNVTDARGVLTGGVGSFPPTQYTYIVPRTIGLAVEKSF